MTDSAIAGMLEQAGPRLFARNVRGFLGNNAINKGMETTLARHPEFFWYYNNGITVICDDAKQEGSRGKNLIRVSNPQVINGQQTTRTLARSARKASRASVLVRVICVPRSVTDDGDHFNTLVSSIVAATNWQNAIRTSDLMSNDRRQIEIERQLRKRNYLYLRKRMTKGEARRGRGFRALRLLKKEELAQAVAGCDLDPSTLREGKERLFEPRWYRRVFPTSNANYYLSRYWLMREVSYAARGYPERAYAKWLVLNFLWSRAEPRLRARAFVEALIQACERDNSTIVEPLLQAINTVYREALRFYRARRGIGEKAIDVSSFFRIRSRHIEFRRYWEGSRNKSRPGFHRAWSQFETAIHRVVSQ
jgi:hypothetical protein